MTDTRKIHVGHLSSDSIEPLAFKLSDVVSGEIRTALGKPGDDPALLAFLESIETELGSYLVFERQSRQQASLAAQIKLLKRLSESAYKAHASIHELNVANYRSLNQALLSTKGLAGSLEPHFNPETGLADMRLSHPLDELAVEIDGLALLADTLQATLQKQVKRGKPAKHYRKALFDSLVRRYYACFGKWPTSTLDSPFEQTMRAALEAAGIVLEDVTTEIKESLKRVRGK